MANDNHNIEFSPTYDSQIVLYQPDETISLEVKLEQETVWLNRQQMAELFGRDVKTIGKHINNALREELSPGSTLPNYSTVGAKSATPQPSGNPVVAKFATTATDGKTYQVEYYNLDVILSVGYRVKSNRGIQFRRWANTIIKDYLLRGYSINRQLIAMQERSDERFIDLQHQIDKQKDKVDFLVKIHNQPTENLFATGCMWDAYTYIASLIRSAKEQIILVDNYCDDKTLTLLDHRTSGIPCTIHTTFNKIIEDALEKHNSQCEPIQRIQLPHKIHDRFLIIDTQVYLIGNSLKDMGHTLSAIIQTGFTPEEVISRLK